jgi:tetratricopeptide (TPR) repeat protein
MFRAQAGLIESSLMSGNYRQALDDLDKLNYGSDDNQRVLTLMYKAQAYYGMNRFGDAIEILEEILRIDPGYQPAVNILKKIRQED